MRAPSAGSAAQSQPLSRPPSRPPSRQSHSQPVDPSRQPSKKFKADGSTTTARQISKGKGRELQASTRAEPEVEEDVRLMQSETDTLRRKSQAAENSIGTLNTDFAFPASKTNRQQQATPSQRIHDASLPLPLQETPQIERNRFMRGEPSSHRRKSSLSRGKRISSSYEATGVICKLSRWPFIVHLLIVVQLSPIHPYLIPVSTNILMATYQSQHVLASYSSGVHIAL